MDLMNSDCKTIKQIIPVILAGGTGSRLWPLSRKSFPKQFLALGGENSSKKSLFQLTLERLKNLNLKRDPIVICNEENRFLVAEQMRTLNIKPYKIILEPFGRNTAPAINLAAIKALELKKDLLILILSSDHIISLEDQFKKAINAAIEYALKNSLVTFGIVPTSPETGYGYIKSYEPLIENPIKGSNIEKFIEKPDLTKAKEFLKNKKFTWNSGIFLFKANQIIEDSEASTESQVNTTHNDNNGSYLINGGRKGYRKNTVKRMMKKQNSRKKRTKAARQKKNY